MTEEETPKPTEEESSPPEDQPSESNESTESSEPEAAEASEEESSDNTPSEESSESTEAEEKQEESSDEPSEEESKEETTEASSPEESTDETPTEESSDDTSAEESKEETSEKAEESEPTAEEPAAEPEPAPAGEEQGSDDTQKELDETPAEESEESSDDSDESEDSEEKSDGDESEAKEEAAENPNEIVYVLRTTANREEQVVDFVSSNASKKKLGVHSIIHPHGMRGYVFIEAETRSDAEQAAFNIPYARGILGAPVKYVEIEHMLEQVKKEVNIHKNDICEIISGPFKREKAKITRIDKTKEEVVVELLESAVPIPITLKLDAVKVIRRDTDDDEGEESQELDDYGL